MEIIKVVLSCPQVIFREGIHFILSGEEDFQVSGETTGNMEALELIEANPPHIAVLCQADVRSDSAEVTRRIKGSYPAVSVILITDINDGEKLFPAIVSGVSAVFAPDIDPENMLAIFRDTAQGRMPVLETMLTPAVAARTIADFKDLATLNERLGIGMAQLSRKEADILQNIASGDAIGPAAAKAGVTEDAVRNHLRAVLQKLAANDRYRTVIEKTQMTLHSFIPGLKTDSGEGGEYLTRAEFNEFKNALMAGFKSLVGEKA